MATLYNKTALKKIKKDDLIEMFLAQQARDYNSRMDDTDYRADLEELTGKFYDQSHENQQLKEENKKLKEGNERWPRIMLVATDKIQRKKDDLEQDYFKLEESNDKLKEENEKLKQIIRHQKDILDEVEHSLHDENEQLKTDLEELY
jgi:uncharacterized phage infection (PIP) family protein YhgE